MNIKKIVEGMTALEVATVIEGNFSEVDKEKVNKTEFNNLKEKVESENAGGLKVESAINAAEAAEVKAEGAINIANTAKNAVSTLAGLSNATEAAKTLAEQVVKIEENRYNIGVMNIDLSKYEEKPYCLGSKGWYISDSGVGKHRAIPLTNCSFIEITCGEVGQYIGFATSGYSVPTALDQDVPYSEFEPYRIWQYENTTTRYNVPSDAAYLILGTEDGLGNKGVYNNISFYLKMGVMDKINKAQMYESTDIDLDKLPTLDCSLGSDGWYINGSYGRHKAIPVSGYNKVQVKVTGGNNGGWMGFVTKDYTNTTPSNGSSVPYSYRYRERIWQYDGEVVTYDLCPDIEYLIVCVVDGGGNAPVFDVWLESDKIIPTQHSITQIIKELREKDKSNLARLRILGWNIGHYCYGTGTTTNVTNANYMEQRTAYRELLNKYGADLIGLIEYSDVFNSSTGESAETAILSPYTNKLFGDVRNGGYVCNGIVTNLRVSNIRQLLLPNDYYAIEGCVDYMGSNFKVVVAHLPWQTEEMNVESAQILIDEYAGEDKVVIIGDFNIYDTSLYDLFADAGYNMANHGYLGDVVTRPETGTFLDNIMVKGGNIIHSEFPNSDLSDHLPVVVDIVI